jgi:hypothetical protein
LDTVADEGRRILRPLATACRIEDQVEDIVHVTSCCDT